MKYLLIITIFTSSLLGVELKIKADFFNADEQKGLSIFKGNVNIVKENDEINASKVVINTDENHKPTKFEADGNISFHIETKDGAVYYGKSQKIIYSPMKKEYSFFNDVYLSQVNEKKVIIGDEVVLQIVDGKAYAKGKKSEPVIMIFDIPENKEIK